MPLPTKDRVLVIEDDEALCRSVVRALERAGFATTGATSCATAREALDTTPPDAVVCDFQLGDGTCFDVVEALTARGIAPPVLVVSGALDPALVERLTDAGVARCLAKPVEPPALVAAVRALLAS